MKPERYEVMVSVTHSEFKRLIRKWGHEDDVPLECCYEYFQVETIHEARRILNRRMSGRIIKRKNIIDATPQGDPAGLLYDWDEVVIEEKD